MSTIEKLFVQIFERKNSIIEQIKHQIDLYDQQLASRLVIEGIKPPSWLWNPGSQIQSSDPKELRKEELISELLRQHPQPSIPYNTGHNSVYKKTVAAVSREQLSDELCTEAGTSSKGLDAIDRSTILSQCPLNGVPELKPKAASPQDRTSVRTSDVYPEPDQSLARFHRSNSRQKALELRNSAKKGATSYLRDESQVFLNCDGNAGSLQCTLNDEVVEPEPNTSSPQATTGIRTLDNHLESDQSLARFHRSKSRQKALEVRNSTKAETKSCLRNENYATLNYSGSAGSMIASLQSNHVNESELVKALDITNERSGVREGKIDGFQSKERGSNIYFGRTTWSRSSGQKSNHLNESSNSHSSSCIANEEGVKFDSVGKRRKQDNHVNESLESMNLLDIIDERHRMNEAIVGDTYRKEKRSNDYFGRITRSRSSCQQFNFGEVSSKPDSSSDIPHLAGDTLRQSKVQAEELCQGPSQIVADTDLPTLQGTQLSAGMPLSGQDDLELYTANTREHQIKESDVNKYVGRQTRSQISYSSERMLQHVNSNISNHKVTRSRSAASNKCLNSKANQKSAARSFSGQNDQKLYTAITREHPSGGNVGNEYTGINTMLQTDHTFEGKPIYSNDSGRKSSQYRNAALHEKPLDWVEVDDLHEASITDASLLPSTGATDRVDEERHGANLEENEIVPDSSVEACAFSSGCEQNGASLRVGLEVLVSRPFADSLMLVKPKQLDFVKMEEQNLNAVFSSSPEETRRDISLGNESSTLLEPLQLRKESSPLRRSASILMEGSWSQNKRRKIEGQVTNVSALPTLRGKALHEDAIDKFLDGKDDVSEASLSSFHEVEIVQSNDDSCHSEDCQNTNYHNSEGSENPPKLQVGEGEVALEGRNEGATTSFTIEKEQFDLSFISILASQETGDSHGCVVDELGFQNQASMILDVRRECSMERDENSMCLGDRPDQGFAEDMTCVEKLMIERKYHIGEDCLNCSVVSPANQYLETIDADQNMPVLEGFIMETDDRQPDPSAGEMCFHEDLPKIERDSILEQLCRSASMDTPLSHFSTAYKLRRTPQLYQSVPNGLLERLNLRSTLHFNDVGGKQCMASPSCMKNEVICASQVRASSDGLPFSRDLFDWNVGKPFVSPIGKLRERTASNSGFSERQWSLNPELTCFPIAEDPSICEEMGNINEATDTFQEEVDSEMTNNSTKRKPLADITRDYQNPPASFCEAEKFHDGGILDSVNMEINYPETHYIPNHYSSESRSTSEAKENQNLSLVANGFKNATESTHNRFSKPKLPEKSSLRKAGPSISQRESKRNNIVSNITSFVPLVQEKQADAVITGKRDIKVKALEAAGAAKRLEEKKQNERKIKKEALKLERARLEQENLRQLELQKKKKEEEQKKRDADMVARKRLREAEERREKEGKRKRIEEARRQQREQEKLRAGKKAKETQCQATNESVLEKKESRDDTGKHKKMEQENRDNNKRGKQDIDSRDNIVSATDIQKESIVCEASEAHNADVGTVMSNMDKRAGNENSASKTSQEKSYEISPYQGSDDEEEEEDDIPNTKFVPSWASKNSLAMSVASQQQIDPDVILPPQSFCSIAEVLRPRKQKLK